MATRLTISNYRCFPDSRPVRLTLGKGFTALLGVNNSGKSALLKFFFEFRQFFSRLAYDLSATRDLLRGSSAVVELAGIADSSEFFCNTNDRPLSIQIEIEPDSTTTPTSIVRLTARFPRDTTNVFSIEAQNTDGDNAIHQGSVWLTEGQAFGIAGTSYWEIGQLRAACKALADTIYLPSFRNAVNIGGLQNFYDIQVGEHFIRSWRQFKTGNDKRSTRAAYQLTEEIKHIFGFNALEINTAANDQSLLIHVDGQPFRLEELGSGLAQFILVLMNVATRQASYVLIDEPELNLHPSLQLDFLTTLGAYASEGVILATHSVGLARSVATELYTLRRVGRGDSELTPYLATGHLAEFLGELSFAGYRELGFRRVLLVEGPSDVAAVQQFLRQRNKDHEIVLLHLGGSALITGDRASQLAEIGRITPEVSVLIDSERPRADAALCSEREAFVRTCQELGFICCVLERRALENYFSDVAIKKVKGSNYTELAHFERLKESARPWAKAENWRIAREMKLEELDGTDLGEFLKQL